MTHPSGSGFERLMSVMRTLRSPHGCAWDRAQTAETLRPYLLEETYELLQAIDQRDGRALKEELGDLLFEIVFIAQICHETSAFSIDDVAHGVVDKLVRRHPHVFTPEGQPHAEGANSLTPVQVKERWEMLKAQERSADATTAAREKTTLSGVPRTLPALLRAYELSARAATVGFDWVQSDEVLAKLEEELVEFRAAMAGGGVRSAEAEEELGDLFFSLANLARKLGFDPESALRRANDKFQRRFEGMEQRAREKGQELRDVPLNAQEELWGEVKAREHDDHDGKR